VGARARRRVTPFGSALRLVAPICLLVAASAPAIGQDTTLVRPDSVAARPDSVAGDSLPAPRYLIVPTAEPEVPSGPLPARTRYSFTRDSILWAGSLTVADLLRAIPGVYVVRAGFHGQPEYVAYAGRGGAAIELYWDGVELPPLGPDSLFNDLSSYRLSYIQRVDVEVLPTTLRVFLVSERHNNVTPYTYLRVARGDFNTAAYAGIFQKRWRNGLGLNLAGDFLGTDGASGSGRSDQTFDIWARLDWTPSSRTGASYQIRRQRHDRDPVGDAPDVSERFGVRTDYLLAFFAGTRDDGLGLRAEGTISSSSWKSDSITPDVPDQRVRQAQVRVRYMEPTWKAELTGRLGESWVTSEVLARLGWVPLPGVVVSGDARWRRHDLDRTSLMGYATLGLSRGPISLVGGVQYTDGHQAPLLATDSAQKTVDAMIRAGLSTFLLSGHVGMVRREGFRPYAFPELPVIPAFDSVSSATYIEVDLKIRTSRALSFDAWYSAPVRGGRVDLPAGSQLQAADLQPPTHGRFQITFQSQFWRTFRSGSFDFKIRAALESWSTGIGGVDAEGEPIVHAGASFYELFVQVRLSGFKFFWDLRNAYNSPDPYVPGLTYPRSVQVYGVRWEFNN
ncbi:MAG: TonB-dependent receptor plug domain-containing protein, partial [Gemmatimonadota bacterium]